MIFDKHFNYSWPSLNQNIDKSFLAVAQTLLNHSTINCSFQATIYWGYGQWATYNKSCSSSGLFSKIEGRLDKDATTRLR